MRYSVKRRQIRSSAKSTLMRCGAKPRAMAPPPAAHRPVRPCPSETDDPSVPHKEACSGQEQPVAAVPAGFPPRCPCFSMARRPRRRAMSERPQRRDIRIFLSSPGDVVEERRLARELIEGALRKEPAYRDRLGIEYVAWDDPEAPTPMLATEVPQASVNAAKPPPSQCHIVVVVLWSRLGSPFELNGRRWASGTEWEYEDAAGAPGKPDILVYRRTAKPRSTTSTSATRSGRKVGQEAGAVPSGRRVPRPDQGPHQVRRSGRVRQAARTGPARLLARRLPRSEDPVGPTPPFVSDVLARFGVARAAPPAFRAGGG